MSYAVDETHVGFSQLQLPARSFPRHSLHSSPPGWVVLLSKSPVGQLEQLEQLAQKCQVSLPLSRR